MRANEEQRVFRLRNSRWRDLFLLCAENLPASVAYRYTSNYVFPRAGRNALLLPRGRGDRIRRLDFLPHFRRRQANLSAEEHLCAVERLSIEATDRPIPRLPTRSAAQPTFPLTPDR
jgi:hypothetical protein